MLSKLEKLLLKWTEPYEYKRPRNVTLYMIREMQRIYHYLNNGQRAYFFTCDLVPYLKKCEVNVDEHGIGYVAYL